MKISYLPLLGVCILGLVGPQKSSCASTTFEKRSSGFELDLSVLGRSTEEPQWTRRLQNDAAIDVIGGVIGFTPKEISLFINLTKLGLGLADAIGKMFSKSFNGTSFSQLNEPNGEDKLLAIYQMISYRLNQIQNGVEATQANLRDLTHDLPQLVRWEVALSTLAEYASPISTLYHKFTYYQLHRSEIEDQTLMDFAKAVVSHDTHSVMALMGHIHNMVAPDAPPVVKNFKSVAYQEYEVLNMAVTQRMSIKLKESAAEKKGARLSKKEAQATSGSLYFRPGLFTMLEESLNEYSLCSMHTSPQSLIFGFYTLLALTQARGYAMTSFAWSLLRFYDEGNFTSEERLSKQLYEHYGQSLRDKVLPILASASNAYRKCEPKVHKQGETYEPITELLQGYIENEVDLNPHGTCMSTCREYKHVEVSGCYMSDKQYCGKHRRCKGTVHNCRFMDADAWVCVSKQHGRRYDWIRYESLVVLGKENTCENVVKVDSWWRWLVHCSYCMCLCDDPKSVTTDRFISLMPSVSDVQANKVLTGVRFVKKNRVMHIQVQEGKAAPQGLIDYGSTIWADVEPISVYENSSYVSGTHFATLKYEMRNMDLDKLTAPRGHVITGLRFRMLGSHINLETWVTPINFTTGVLKPHLSYWISNDATPISETNPRQKVRILEPADPTLAPGIQKIDSKNNTYVRFQPTSMTEDVSQLTVPFFDAQPVAPSPPSWLFGIELYHKGQLGYGGFLAFKTFSYNLTQQFFT